MIWGRDGRDWPNRAASRFLRAGGLRWHVQELGDPQKPVCLLLHGTGGATHSWAELAPLLADRFRVVAPDLPGHGFTARPLHARGFTLTGMARAVSALLGEIGCAPEHIVGHSAGAAIGLQMHLDDLAAPRTVVGLNAALIPFKGMAGQVFPALAKLLVMNPLVPTAVSWSASRARVKGLLDGTGSRLSPQGFEYYRRLFNDPGHVGAALAMMANWDLETLRGRWDDVAVPVHLVVGTQDGTVPPGDADEIKAHLPCACVHQLDGLGHLAHEEAPERAASAILDIFASEAQMQD